jgi:anti-sigma B factor antagonist
MESLSLGGIVDVRVPELAAGGVPYVVEVGGDLDIASVDDLEGPVIHAIRDGREPVILDLSECAFIDSSGIRLVLRAHHLLRERADGNGDGRVLAVVAKDHVAKLLRLTAVDKVIPVVSSRAEAEGMLDIARRV